MSGKTQATGSVLAVGAGVCTLLVLLAIGLALPGGAATRKPTGFALSSAPGEPVVRTVEFGDSRLQVSLAPGDYRLPEQAIIDWVRRSARATATFFGRFPVSEVRISFVAVAGDDVMRAVTWADPDARIRIALGKDISATTLKRDSTMVHEMTHLAFPDLSDTHLWLHEGIATYVESIARAQAREITPARMWAHFVSEMPAGLPERGDQGLDDTPSEDRRYWGGALFCLTADIEIRRRTNNRYGLRDGLRAILEAGGTLRHTWQVERALNVGDRAVGVPVLRELFATWQSKSVSPDLDALWGQLGIRHGGGVRLVEAAPLAKIRSAITEPPQRPLLLVGPSLLYETVRDGNHAPKASRTPRAGAAGQLGATK